MDTAKILNDLMTANAAIDRASERISELEMENARLQRLITRHNAAVEFRRISDEIFKLEKRREALRQMINTLEGEERNDGESEEGQETTAAGFGAAGAQQAEEEGCREETEG